MRSALVLLLATLLLPLASADGDEQKCVVVFTFTPDFGNLTRQATLVIKPDARDT